MDQRTPKLGLIVGLTSFAVFSIVAVAIGGDALNGHTSEGHYLLANHGKLTEVSYATYL